ncbi:IclR family transcriptional regulator [Ramlibacter sp. AW1]|uniref:IclR family transcriptional regulator n=1 Tax=Ramlibacter aurantiacus TaxID=2801330 RepID=A0A936ZK38_9BURK|nr:IclR family transcriptional regulator [Ramlibacter aurantiacus]MBL0419191.1 IclR family transcriptional regulator [Ramlibacter aurantiacus]
MPVNHANPAASERRGIQSVEIAYRVLTAMAQSPRALPLREIAAEAGLSPSAANNYLVSLVRCGLARTDDRPGHYRLGASLLSLGMSVLQQIDGYDVLRAEVTRLRDETARNTALAGWSDAGPVSLFKQDGEHRGAFELRTGVIPLASTAAGKVFMACLPPAMTRPLLRKELAGGRDADERVQAAVDSAVRELERNRYAAVTSAHPSGYVSVAAPVWDVHGEIRFSISLMDSRGRLDTSRNGPHVKALLEATERASVALGGGGYARRD